MDLLTQNRDFEIIVKSKLKSKGAGVNYCATLNKQIRKSDISNLCSFRDYGFENCSFLF